MGSLLLAAAIRTCAFAAEFWLMEHQPSGGFQGQATDLCCMWQESEPEEVLNEIT